MPLWHDISQSALVERIGEALLLGSVQIVAIALLTAVAWRLMRRAELRYVAGCMALAIVLAAPVASFLWLTGEAAERGTVTTDVGPVGASLDGTPTLPPALHKAETAPVEAPAAVSRSPEPYQAEGATAPAAEQRDNRLLGAERQATESRSREVAGTTEEMPSLRTQSSEVDGTSLSPILRIQQLVWPWLPHFVLVWAIGVLVLAARPVIGAWTLHTLRHRGHRPISPTLQVRFIQLLERVGLRHAVTLVESSRVHAPLVIGWLRPMILLPASALTGLPPRELEAVLLHELAHVRRHDALINLLQTLVETLLFFHPAVWWLSARLRQEREHCCDDFAARVLGDRIPLARALLHLEEQRQAHPLALAASAPKLLPRVQRLLGRTPHHSTLPGWIAGALLALVPVTALALGLWQEKETPQPSSSPRAQEETTTESAEPQDENEELEETWEVFGQVTDREGNSIAGTVVRAMDWEDTVVLGSTTSNQDGEFWLEFSGPPSFRRSTHAVVRITAERGDLRCDHSIWIAKELISEINDAAAFNLRSLLPNEMLRQNLVVAPSTRLRITVQDPAGLPTRDLSFLPVEGNWGSFRRLSSDSIWAASACTIEVGLSQTARTLIARIHLPAASGDYTLTLEPKESSLALVSAVDSEGNDVTRSFALEAMPPTPSLGQRVGLLPMDTEVRARDILRRVVEANVYWLTDVPPGIHDYSFEIDGKTLTSNRDLGRKPLHRSLPHRLKEILDQPEGTTVRVIENDVQGVKIAYSLDRGLRLDITNGLTARDAGPRSHVSDLIEHGLLWIDLTNHTILRHSANGIREIYSDYVELDEGRFVPKTIEIGGRLSFRWDFEVYEPGLWLIHSLTGPDRERREVTNVTVNGKPGVLSDARTEERQGLREGAAGGGRTLPYKARWIVGGRVTDTQGRPIPGAKITTRGLLREATSVTNDRGDYSLEIPEALFDPEPGLGELARFEANAIDYLPSETEQRILTLRRGDLEPMRFAPGRLPENAVVEANEPHRLDFVLVRPVSLFARVLDRDGREVESAGLGVGVGKELTSPGESGWIGGIVWQSWNVHPSREHILSVKTSRARAYALPLRLSEPGEYRVTLQLLSESTGSTTALQIVRVEDELGRDITKEVVFRGNAPPLQEEQQQEARGVLRRAAQINRYWLGELPSGVSEFGFQLDGQTFSGSTHGLRTPSFDTLLDRVPDRLDEIVFRSIERAPDSIELAYSLREPARARFSTGVTAHGALFRSFEIWALTGTIRINSARWTPIEETLGEARIELSEYQEIAPGHFAPRQIDIDDPLDFEWQFEVYEPGLWLIHSLTGPDRERREVTNITVNGKPGVVREPREGERPSKRNAAAGAVPREGELAEVDSSQQKQHWIIEGQATDSNGRPIPNATVEAEIKFDHSPYLRKQETTTDDDGLYRLRISASSLGKSSPCGMVRLSIDKPGWVDSRPPAPYPPGIPLLLEIEPRLPAPPPMLVVDEDGARLGEPYRVDFRLREPAVLLIEIVDADGESMAPNGLEVEDDFFSEPRWVRGPDERPACEVRPGEPWNFSLPSRHWGVRTRSSAIRPPVPGIYEITLSWRRDSVDTLRIESALGPTGRDLTNEIVERSHYTRLPLPEAEQVRAREILRQVAEVNQYWLTEIHPEVESYTYRLDRHDVVSRPAADDARRTIHESPLQHLGDLVDGMTIRSFEVEGDTIDIAFTLHSPFQAVSGSFESDTRATQTGPPLHSPLVLDGRLRISSNDWSVIEHDVRNEFTESYADYLALDDQHLVPRVMTIFSPRFHPPTVFRFAVYEPGLWIVNSFEALHRTDVTDVTVNGRPAVPMER